MKIVHKLLTAKCFKRLGRPWKQFYTDSCGKKAKQAALPPTTALSLARYVRVRVRVRAKVGVGVKDICHVICVVQETTCVLMCEWVEKRMSLSISSDQSRSRSESRRRGRSAASAASSLAWIFGLGFWLSGLNSLPFVGVTSLHCGNARIFLWLLLRSLVVGSGACVIASQINNQRQ